MNPLDMDSAEIRILRAITELNNRIMMQATPEQRAILRGSIENLRRELISLVESIHIYSEDDVRAARRGAEWPVRWPCLDGTGESLAMAMQFSTDELMQLIEYQLYLDHPELNRDNRERGGLFIPFSLIVRNNVVIGMIVAEPGEDIDQLEWSEKRR